MKSKNISLIELRLTGISITTKKQEHRGLFYPKIHRIITDMYGHLLNREEHFYLSSDLLIAISVACKTPFASDEEIIQSIEHYFYKKKKVS